MKQTITSAKPFEPLEKLTAYEQLKLQFKQEIIINSNTHSSDMNHN